MPNVVALDDLRRVDGLSDRPSHVAIGVMVHQLVEEEEVDRPRRVDTDAHVAVALECLDLGRREGIDDLDLAALQLQHTLVVIADELEDDLVDVRLAALPVVVVASERDQRALLRPLLQHERAGTDGIGEELLLRHAAQVLGEDGVRVDRQVGEQRRPRLRERDLDGASVDGRHVRDGEVQEAHGPGLAEPCTVEGPGHVVGRHRLAVGERDALFEGERVDETVAAHRMLLDHQGLQLPARVGRVQRLVHLVEGVDIAAADGDVMRVETLGLYGRLRTAADDQRAARLGAACAPRGRRGLRRRAARRSQRAQRQQPSTCGSCLEYLPAREPITFPQHAASDRSMSHEGCRTRSHPRLVSSPTAAPASMFTAKSGSQDPNGAH